MSDLQDRLRRLKAFNAIVQRQDSELAEESADLRRRTNLDVAEGLESAGVFATVQGEDPLQAEIGLESIVLRRERPVLAIRNGGADLTFRDQADSAIWKKRLEDASLVLGAAIRAAGRIELIGGDLAWVGTGWLVHEDILVTNRHVALEFARRDGNGFVFRQGSFGPIEASVDFLEEIDNPDELVFKLREPLHIEDAPGPDVAFFKVELASGQARLAKPLQLSAKPTLSESIAVIGYPAYDGRIPDIDLMENLFGKVYDRKRLAPGAITAINGPHILHNATTLGGNSGSCVLDLNSGEAFGLHFSGRFLATNYAVPSDVVRALLEKVLARNRFGTNATAPLPQPDRHAEHHSEPRPETQPGPAAAVLQPVPNGTTLTTTIMLPITVSVSIGTPTVASPTTPAPTPSPKGGFEGDIEGLEGVPEDYRDRGGYDPDFLGTDDGLAVPLPGIAGALSRDILSFSSNGRDETELRYEHFSVLMSRSRRMCFFSAVNIDGGAARKTRRTEWRWDPRIPRAQQIMNECYGDTPRFSRGHMTRREDPAWGDDITAKRGNSDSMHVTNATPQMQSFNAPIWLELEDYALGHAREDRMRISVFTGPYFTDKDPVLYGVRIPLRFWKIIAFIHDETGVLSATGYEMGQEAELRPQEEFVFGNFKSSHVDDVVQLPIATIENRSGIDFGPLVDGDALGGEASGAPRRLTDIGQVRFLR